MVEKTDFNRQFDFLSTNHDVFLRFLESCNVIIVPRGGGGMTFLKHYIYEKGEHKIFKILKKRHGWYLKNQIVT